MEEYNKVTKDRANPRAEANILSVFTFWWTLKIFRTGHKRPLNEDDLFPPLKDQRSHFLGDKLEKEWATELLRAKEANNEPSLRRVFRKLFGLRVMALVVFTMVPDTVFKVSQPLLLGKFTSFFGPGNAMNLEEAYVLATALVLCGVFRCICIHYFFHSCFVLGLKMRTMVCSLMFRKCLRLSRTAMSQATVGHVINLMSNDVKRLERFIALSTPLWLCPLDATIIIYLLWTNLGPSCLTGMVYLVIFIPVQGFLGRKASSFRGKTAGRTDERIRLMNEIISGIEVIKAYAWEKPFSELVAWARRKEISVIKTVHFIHGIAVSSSNFSPRIGVFICIIIDVLVGNKITAERVFVLSAFYFILRRSLTYTLSIGVKELSEAAISIDRIQKFLLSDESSAADHQSRLYRGNDSSTPHQELVPLTTKENVVEILDSEKKGVFLENASASWTPDSAEKTLKNLTLSVGTGDLVAVIGQVGSGKSSLLHCILRELPLTGGSLRVSGRVSYAPQEPWLFPSSVRQNILFGQPFVKSRYDKVVRTCSLNKDFKLFPYGDRTLVGEKGVVLSGGQRARIGLARAIYVDADIYLLDDPLSAVDSRVGRQLFDGCVRGFLKDKACVLVTHQIQYVKDVNKILLLNNGNVEAVGSYKELQESSVDWTNALMTKDHQEETVQDGRGGGEVLRRDSNMTLSGSVESVASVAGAFPEPEQVTEKQSLGRVQGRVYWDYFRAGASWPMVLFMIMALVTSEVVASGTDYWLAFWVNAEERRAMNVSSSDLDNFISSKANCMAVYSAMIALLVALVVGSCVLFFTLCMRASVNLHDRMFNNVSRAKMLFFNTNPAGRILNRFSKDMGLVDEALPSVMNDTITNILMSLGIIIVVGIINWWLLLPAAVILYGFYVLREYYLCTSRSVQRLEGITRSPVFSHVNSSLQGLSTIRALKAESVLEKEFDKLQDTNSSAFYLTLALGRMYGVWTDAGCVMHQILTAFSFLVMGHDWYGGDVGLAISFSVRLTGSVQFMMREWAQMENQMTAVERILEYTQLEQESPLESPPDSKPSEDWPSQGQIVFSDVSLRYSPEESPVLKNLCFSVEAKSKVGVVGRTGAGKTSLITALLRLAHVDGAIVIDNVDTGDIGLHDLRRKVSVIPQEPVLFSGTLRRNLDPFDEYPDHVLWKALEEVQLRAAVDELEAGLDSKVQEGGSNFSVGQRQLVCLARAVIKDNRILVMDEATANVDLGTDALIQDTIRRKFKDCTVLTIAHRLHTVIDSDKILVVDEGEVVEYDTPYNLLRNPDGTFYKMAEKTGKVMMESLIKATKNMSPADDEEGDKTRPEDAVS